MELKIIIFIFILYSTGKRDLIAYNQNKKVVLMKFWMRDNNLNFSKYPYEINPALVGNLKYALDLMMKRLKSNPKK